MTWATFLSTGSGKLAFRLVIEGCPYEAVTDSAMEGTQADGRIRAVGLSRETLQFEEEVDIGQAELETSGFTVEIIDRQVDSIWTKAFAYRPTLTTYLTADTGATDLTFPVTSTTGLTVGDIVHVGTEAVQVDVLPTSTSFQCSAVSSRAMWQTIAQKHWAHDVDLHVQAQAITDRPYFIEGRRVYLYAYGEGDTLTGDGTLVFKGLCSTDARFDGSSKWSFTVDHIGQILAQDMGATFPEAMPIRGIYYPWNASLYIILLGYTSSSGKPPEDGTAGTPQEVFINGFFEDTDDFIAEMNTQLATVVGSISGIDEIKGVDRGDGTWYLAYHTSTTSATLVAEVRSVLDPSGKYGYPHHFDSEDGDGYWASTANDTWYHITHVGELRGFVSDTTVPRAHFHPLGPLDYLEDEFSDATKSAAPPLRLYLGGATEGIGAATEATIYKEGRRNITVNVTTADATSRYIDCEPTVEGGGAGSVRVPMDGEDSITLGIVYASGADLDGFRDSLVSAAVLRANVGGAPFVTSDDLADWDAIVAEASAGKPYLTTRNYHQFGKVELAEFLSHEWRLRGMYPIIDSSRKITMALLAVPSPTEPTDGTVSASTLIVSEGHPAWERNGQFGTTNSVIWKTKWDPVEEEHTGQTYEVRDKTGLAIRKVRNSLEIAPRSTDTSGSDPAVWAQEVAAPVLGMFGRDYAVMEVNVPWSLFSVLLGDLVTVSAPHVPNTTDGTRGITNATGLVYGRRWAFNEPFGTLKLFIYLDDVAGYAPSAYISAASGSGVDWTLTLDTSDDPLGVDDYYHSSQTAADHFAAGDEIELLQWDSTVPTTRSGSVDSISADGTSMDVTLDASWTGLGGNLYIVKYGTASAADASQQAYVYHADAAAEIGFSTTRTARVYGP